VPTGRLSRWARRTEVGLARLRHSNVSKSATADFDERAFAHPTQLSRSNAVLTLPDAWIGIAAQASVAYPAVLTADLRGRT
jgi:hypothetical protein